MPIWHGIYPACIAAIDARASAHDRARKMARSGHQPRLIAARYVKPFVKCHKNDSNDAQAITEAAPKPTMRFVAPKNTDQQAQAALFRVRTQLVRLRTDCINALQAFRHEFGLVALQHSTGGRPVLVRASKMDKRYPPAADHRGHVHYSDRVTTRRAKVIWPRSALLHTCPRKINDRKFSLHDDHRWIPVKRPAMRSL